MTKISHSKGPDVSSHPKKEVKESKAVLRARRKLEEQIKDEEKQITPDAIKAASEAIRYYIERHGDERIKLKEKVSFFDGNAHMAPTKSKAILKLMKKLEIENKSFERETPDLAGRVSRK